MEETYDQFLPEKENQSTWKKIKDHVSRNKGKYAALAGAALAAGLGYAAMKGDDAGAPKGALEKPKQLKIPPPKPVQPSVKQQPVPTNKDGLTIHIAQNTIDNAKVLGTGAGGLALSGLLLTRGGRKLIGKGIGKTITGSGKLLYKSSKAGIKAAKKIMKKGVKLKNI